MKVLSTVLLLSMNLLAFAQSGFTGTVEYSYTYTGEGADQMSLFAPSGAKYTIGKNKLRMETSGGFSASMMGYLVVDGDKTYMVQDDEGIAYLMNNEGTEEEKPTITKENETKTILGYTCTKYISTATMDGQKVTTILWVTSELKPTLDGSQSAWMGYSVDEADGMLLESEVEYELPDMTITTVMTATSVAKEKPSSKMFKVPKGYEIKNMYEEESLDGGSN